MIDPRSGVRLTRWVGRGNVLLVTLPSSTPPRQGGSRGWLAAIAFVVAALAVALCVRQPRQGWLVLPAIASLVPAAWTSTTAHRAVMARRWHEAMKWFALTMVASASTFLFLAVLVPRAVRALSTLPGGVSFAARYVQGDVIIPAFVAVALFGESVLALLLSVPNAIEQHLSKRERRP